MTINMETLSREYVVAMGRTDRALTFKLDDTSNEAAEYIFDYGLTQCGNDATAPAPRIVWERENPEDASRLEKREDKAKLAYKEAETKADKEAARNAVAEVRSERTKRVRAFAANNSDLVEEEKWILFQARIALIQSGEVPQRRGGGEVLSSDPVEDCMYKAAKTAYTAAIKKKFGIEQRKAFNAKPWAEQKEKLDAFIKAHKDGGGVDYRANAEKEVNGPGLEIEITV